MDINRYSPRYGVNYKHMTKLADFSTEEIFEFLYAARAMKDKFIAHEDTRIFRDVTLALLFAEDALGIGNCHSPAWRRLHKPAL